nr:MAG TPA: hypothetical protein [Caudoviricetes sp.]
MESSFADEAADGLDVELPAGGVFGDCYCVIFSVHKSYYITVRVLVQLISYRCVIGIRGAVRRVLGIKKVLNRRKGAGKPVEHLSEVSQYTMRASTNIASFFLDRNRRVRWLVVRSACRDGERDIVNTSNNVGHQKPTNIERNRK